MELDELTIHLPKASLEFAERYAKAHGITVTDLIQRYFQALQVEVNPIHPEVEAISGLIPSEEDVEAEYREHLRAKHPSM